MTVNTSKPIVNDTIKFGLLDSHNGTTERNGLSTVYRRAEQLKHGKGTDNMETDEQ
jgi:hypothetical protein